MVKNPPAKAGNVGSIPGLGRSPGKGNGNPLQYSFLDNSTDRGAWQAPRPWGHKELDITERLTHTHTSYSDNLKSQSSQFRPKDGREIK